MESYTMVNGNGPTERKIIKNIEWHMLDKTKFYPLTLANSLTIRSIIYPLSLIKTRLQVQKHSNLYAGMFDAYRKIYGCEGFTGLYRGFLVSSIHVVNGTFYISTYERVRHFLHKTNVNSSLKAFIAGTCASLITVTVLLPIDVLTQHLMMMGVDVRKEHACNNLGLKMNPYQSKSELTKEIVRQIYKMDGFSGFYRGYFATMAVRVPNSALWWGFYQFYQDKITFILPSWFSLLLLHTISGTLSGFTTTILTNPLDVVKTRLQVQRLDSIRCTFRNSWKEEGLNIFTKGLNTRLIQSAIFSFSIMVGYESIKRLSVKEEYMQFVKW